MYMINSYRVFKKASILGTLDKNKVIYSFADYCRRHLQLC